MLAPRTWPPVLLLELEDELELPLSDELDPPDEGLGDGLGSGLGLGDGEGSPVLQESPWQSPSGSGDELGVGSGL